MDGTQEGPRQGEGPGPLQAHAETPVPAREGPALLQEKGGERGGLREGPLLQLQTLPQCKDAPDAKIIEYWKLQYKLQLQL